MTPDPIEEAAREWLDKFVKGNGLREGGVAAFKELLRSRSEAEREAALLEAAMLMPIHGPIGDACSTPCALCNWHKAIHLRRRKP